MRSSTPTHFSAAGQKVGKPVSFPLSASNDDADEATPSATDASAAAAAAEWSGSANPGAFEPRPTRLLGWAGACLRLRVRGPFERKVAWGLRLSVTCTLALTVATAPPIASRLPGPFLCPVLAVLACVSSVGASLEQAWQIVKGAFYAALFGFVLFVCGVNRAQNSRIETAVLLFLFCLWAKYAIRLEELTTKKLAVAIAATILITQLNYSDERNYSWRIFLVACLASLCGVIGSVFPFPNSALKEAEERWSHALRQSAHLFHLLTAAFSCTSRGEIESKLLLVRIEQTIAHLLANRDAIKARIKEAEWEFPILFYHLLFGTHNNYTWSRFLRHFHSFEQLCDHAHCMLFAARRFRFDEFHNAAAGHLKHHLHTVSHALEGWMLAVSAADRKVHRSQLLAPALRHYSSCVTTLFQSFVQFRANMYFHSRLFLVDTLDGQQALLRQSPRRHKRKRKSGHGAQSISPESAATVTFKGHKIGSPAMTYRSPSLASSCQLSLRKDSASAGATSSVLLAVSPEPQLNAFATSPTPAQLTHPHGGGRSLLTLPRLHPAAISSPVAPSVASPLPALSLRAHLTAVDDTKTKPGAGAAGSISPQLTATSVGGKGKSADWSTDSASSDDADEHGGPGPSLAEMTWTSDDVMSLHFFFFQVNEFTKRALKLAAEPGEEYGQSPGQHHPGRSGAGSESERDAPTGSAAGAAAATGPAAATGWFDPIAHYHLDSVRRVPRLLSSFLRSSLRSQWSSLRASCAWDRQRFVEAVKLALAITLASTNELMPRSWTPIYERKSHGWWAPVTLAFTMGDNLGTHVASMNLRVLGTLAGAVFGYVASQVCAGNLVALVAVLVVWNVITTVQRLDAQFGYAWLVAGFTASVVAVGSDPQHGSVSQFAFVRIEENLAGVLVGMFVHNFIFPLRASTLLQREVAANLERIRCGFVYSFAKYQQRVQQLLHTGSEENAKGRAASAGNQPVAPGVDVPLDEAPSVGEWLTRPAPFPSHSTEPLMGGSELASELPSASPPDSDAPTTSTTATQSATAELDPLHSFRRIGPELQQSLESQLKLRRAAGGEPTLWRSPFPGDAYDRVTELQRSITLYLFVMDLSLQRIVQSESRYLMPDLCDNFARLQTAVASSIDQIVRGIQADVHAPLFSCRRASSDDPVQSAPESLPSPSRRVLDLLSLHASLEELDERYKRWIDSRILAQRNAIEHTHGPAQEQSEGKEERVGPEPGWTGPHSCPLVVQVSPSGEEQPTHLGVQTSGGARSGAAAGVSGFDDRPLKPIPLFTPVHHERRLAGAHSHPFAARPGMLSPPMRPLVRRVDARDTASNSLGGAAEAPRPGLVDLDVTLTRSMDVLALNSFLFATRGLIGELMSLSQAVRVLLHRRRPAELEEEF